MAKQKKRQMNGDLYAGLMEELKLRLRTIDTVFLQKSPINGTIVRECCFLQLRMCCEVLALACLVAHGDIQKSKINTLLKEYKADKLMKRLEEINPKFYPISFRKKRHNDGFILSEFKGEILSKEDLLSLYRLCGDVLHRGHAKKLLATDKPLPNHISDVREYVEKFWNLLYQHRIILAGNSHLLCQFENSDDSNRVQVAHAVGEQPPNVEASQQPQA